MTKTIEKPSKTLINSYNSQKQQQKNLTKVYMTMKSWSTSCIFQKVVKCKYLRN